jgi:hypothetical protein
LEFVLKSAPAILASAKERLLLAEIYLSFIVEVHFFHKSCICSAESSIAKLAAIIPPVVVPQSSQTIRQVFIRAFVPIL